jgi:hypothetical protein
LTSVSDRIITNFLSSKLAFTINTFTFTQECMIPLPAYAINPANNVTDYEGPAGCLC